METNKDAVHELLTALVSSLNNTIYDLATDSERAGNKVTANRLEFSRQKIMTAWTAYTQKVNNKISE